MPKSMLLDTLRGLFMPKKTIKLFWWRYDESSSGNFGDEISKLLIEKLFCVNVEWASPDTCDLIGAGSILTEVYENKKDNKPFVWGSGIIENGQSTIADSEFKFCSVRGLSTLGRITGSKNNIAVGDPGLLASYLLPPIKSADSRKFRLGILPHYVDADIAIVQQLAKHEGVLVIDATQPCLEVIRSISQCQAILSSSLHGLIVSDSLGVPNIHLKLSDNLKGGQYKFSDYYSVFREERYHSPLTANDITDLSVEQIHDLIIDGYVIPQNITTIKQRIIDSFPIAELR